MTVERCIHGVSNYQECEACAICCHGRLFTEEEKANSIKSSRRELDNLYGRPTKSQVLIEVAEAIEDALRRREATEEVWPGESMSAQEMPLNALHALWLRNIARSLENGRDVGDELFNRRTIELPSEEAEVQGWHTCTWCGESSTHADNLLMLRSDSPIHEDCADAKDES
jgi:hypothetical protein